MKFVRLAYFSALYGYKALFAWNTPALFFAVLIIGPLVQVGFFVMVGAAYEYEDPAFFIFGNAIQAASAAGISGLASVIAEERMFGTLRFLVMSPGSKLAVLLGRLIPGLLASIFVSGMLFVLGCIVTGWPFGVHQLLTAGALVAAAAFSSSAVGLCISAVGLVYRDVFYIASGMALLTLVCSGANVRRDELPVFLQWVGAFLPQTNAIDGVRMLQSGSTSSANHAGMEVLVGVAWLVLALVLLMTMESLARRRGSVSLY